MLSDTTTINELGHTDDLYNTDPCKTPIKNFFYKVDLIYCDKYPTLIKSFEINYNPFMDNDKEDMNILEKIVAMYLDLTIKNKE